MVRLFLFCILFISSAGAREHVQIVGSSTVFPFISVISEEFARTYRVKTPMVESTGTSAGFKLFCMGVGEAYPDIAVSSRRIDETELALCKVYSVDKADILEIKLGEDALVIASDAGSNLHYEFSSDDIFRAIAFYVPSGMNLIKNPNKHWIDIDSSRFYDSEIKIYGPLKNTGTFESIKRLILFRHCLGDPAFNLAYEKDKLREICSVVRDDGVYVEASSDENVIVQKLVRNHDAFGLFSYSFFIRNSSKLRSHKIDGVEPTYESIMSGEYGFTRPIHIYVKIPHLDFVPNLKGLLKEILSDNALGTYGYLRALGMIPVPDKELQSAREYVKSLTS